VLATTHPKPGASASEPSEADEVATSVQQPAMFVSTAGLTQGPEIRICALGEAAITIDGKLVTRWRMSRSLELFFLLLEHNRPLRKEQIISALWPDANDNINQTLHSTVYYLRKTLGENCVVSDAGTYWLDLPAQYGERVWYDVEHFQAYHKRAKAALHPHEDEQARRDLEAMIELFRGDYVQSFYSDWCIFRRENLRLIYLDARQQLARLAWRQEQYDECAQHWQHMLAVDNCLEDAHHWLMRIYVRQGKRGLALRQYQRCVRLLRTELKAEPGQAIQNLYQQLTRSQPRREKRASS
jgi:LuxR family maltose regulon positive regulatory protein